MTNISSSSGLGRPYASHAHQDAVFNMQMSVCSVLQCFKPNPFTFDNREIADAGTEIPDLLLLADKSIDKDVPRIDEERVRLAIVEFYHTDNGYKAYANDVTKVRRLMEEYHSIQLGFVINFNEMVGFYYDRDFVLRPISFQEATDMIKDLVLNHYSLLVQDYLKLHPEVKRVQKPFAAKLPFIGFKMSPSPKIGLLIK